ncbi:MAG: 5'-nucleotidase, lipoprotein e(P4) family [Thermoanaerobaculia bacterium]
MRPIERVRRWSALGAFCLSLSCASNAVAPDSAEAPAELPLQIHWVRNSAEYRALLEQSYRLAGEVIEKRSADREPGAWAVAVDADETLISNSQQSKEQALGKPGSFEERWDEWVRRRAAPALPGAIEFLERVRELGGRIAVVTNRREHHCEATADNFRAIELPFDVVLCRGETGDKRPRWQRVVEGKAKDGLPPVEILMWLGDNIHDFPDLDQELRFTGPEGFTEFGDRFFILPNPLYGSWEDNPPD